MLAFEPLAAGRRRANLERWIVAQFLRLAGRIAAGIRFAAFAALVIGALGVIFASSAAADAETAQAVPLSRQQITLSFAPLVKRVAPAVVNIYARQVVRDRAVSPLFNDPFFRRFFGEGFGLPTERVQNSLGSGVIIDPKGLIVTNHHVVKGADEIRVVLADRREFGARLLRSDERTDLAVLKIENGAQRLPALQFGDSDGLEVGDLVLAIGNPFGVGQTVTSGIVSALARTVGGVGDLRFFIQTDAAINPGNSGGALVAMDGKLVGINTAIFSQSGGSVGVGFAVPSNMVTTVVADAETGARLRRPWFGATGQEVTGEIMASLGIARPRGVLVNRVHPRGPAARLGIRVGDIVTRIDGREVNDPQSLRYRVATRRVGDRVRVTYLRDRIQHEAEVRLAAPPEIPPRNLTRIDGPNPLAGAEIADLSPALAEEMGFDHWRDGVVITRVLSGSIAARLRFAPDDIVLSIGGKRVDSVDALRRLVAGERRLWQIEIRRGDQTFTATVRG